MIRFALQCAESHEFEGWFRNGEGYEVQKAAGEICCPDCGSNKVEKAPMAPSVHSSKEKAPISPAQLRAALVELRRQVESNCDYVGAQFAEEARKIHYGDADPRGIYGEASEAETRELVEEGVKFNRIPWAPKLDS